MNLIELQPGELRLIIHLIRKHEQETDSRVVNHSQLRDLADRLQKEL